MDNADWPCADHMHSHMQKTNNIHQTEHVQLAPRLCSISRRIGTLEEEVGQRR
ncbi:unnamed protein product [Staurois parvus]|uniref:Uncharacterized protein n=1 Tax=Staurois parvus TaxID=386267 RepID=A0ABN9GRD7_9NEOB|nr:unnamed protein product [Staurois parvus]